MGKNAIRVVAKRSGGLTEMVVDRPTQDLAPINRTLPGTGRHGNRRVTLKTLMRTCLVIKGRILNQDARPVTLAQAHDVQARVPDGADPPFSRALGAQYSASMTGAPAHRQSVAFAPRLE